MKDSIKKGLGFGLTSGIITTLGLIVGLNSGTHSRAVILGGILVIAIADAMSDALGIHISEEAGHKKISHVDVWESTVSTFLFKFIFALTFVVPILFLELDTAIIVSVVWGLALISGFSFYISRVRGENPFKPVVEHLVIAILVIIITYFVGGWASGFV